MLKPGGNSGCEKSTIIPLARITGAPTLHEGRLYVPVSSYEEAQGADPQYACCTFRGSLVALDAKTGTIDVEDIHGRGRAEAARHRARAGVTLWGPSGSRHLVGAHQSMSSVAAST